VFPRQWKMAVILMIHKPGKPEVDPESYRPISLLPSLSKLWERLISNWINDIITQGNILPDHQFGFWKGHGTIEQVQTGETHITGFWRLRVLQRCLYRYATSLRQSMACWIIVQDKDPSTCARLILKSYLEGRQFKILVRTNYSSIYPMRAGVPQGSVLGPLLIPCTHWYPLPEFRTHGSTEQDSYCNLCRWHRSCI